MGEETNAYDPAGSQFDDDVTAERPTDRAAQSGQKAQATARAAEPVKPLISMSDLPDLRNTFNPNAPLDDSNDLSRDEFTTVYDIIDKLESALDEAKPILFFPGSVRVDRDEFTEQLDQLKKMMPVQLERASALMRESERRLESAQTQANAIVASAQSRAADTIREANEQAQFLAGQENVTELARQKARAILDQAQARADHLTQGADKYCTTVMETLQQQLGKLGNDVQAGLNVLYDRQREASTHVPHLTQTTIRKAEWKAEHGTYRRFPVGDFRGASRLASRAKQGDRRNVPRTERHRR